MGEFAPEHILAVLERHGVRYVLIAGIAAAIHGSDLVTSDVDITPALGEKNLRRLSAALDELGARVRAADAPDGRPFDHGAASLARALVWNLTTDAGDLDIPFVPAGTSGYEDLRRDALELEILGARTVVASLADVVRSKEAAARPKDVAALPTLRKLLDLETRTRRD